MNDISIPLPDEILKAYCQGILSASNSSGSLINTDIPHTHNLANIINKLDLSRYDFTLISYLLLSIVVTPDQYKAKDKVTRTILKLINRLNYLYNSNTKVDVTKLNTKVEDSKFYQEELSSEEAIEDFSPYNNLLVNCIDDIDLSKPKFDFTKLIHLLLSTIWHPNRFNINDSVKEAILKLVNRLQELYRNEKAKQ